ncbi:MAG: glycosyltransferase, partial [Acidimicrobiales bacterium]
MAPAISVVLPVYNVEAYVRASLSSVLATRDVDLEVVVVEDCSTDGSPGIIQAVAAEDGRVKIVQLDHNAGLGNARNVGMDHARGEWILFLDSDDELTPGSLSPMLELGRRTNADMVMFDYARLYWDGERIRNNNAPMFAQGEGPVTVSDRPELLNNLNVAWNKLYRREFLDRIALTFPPGIYEDIPWTYPLLLEADRISLLDRVCLLYRQRREGSILRSASPRHSEVLDQYDRLFAWFDTHPEHAWARDILHAKMASHLLKVFDHGERRLPKGDRSAFYHRMSESVVGHAPSGYQPSGRVWGLRRRVVMSNRYVLERLFQRTRQGRRAVVRWQRGAGEAVVSGKGRLGTFVRLAYYRLQLRRRIDPKLAVFAAYWYSQYGGNPRAISEAVARLAPEYRRVWLIERASIGKVPDSEEVVVVGTWRYYRVL